MRNTLVMTVVQALQNLFEQSCCLLLGEVFFSHDLVEELTTCAELSNQVDILLVFKVFVEFQYIWVIEFL